MALFLLVALFALLLTKTAALTAVAIYLNT